MNTLVPYNICITIFVNKAVQYNICKYTSVVQYMWIYRCSTICANTLTQYIQYSIREYTCNTICICEYTSAVEHMRMLRCSTIYVNAPVSTIYVNTPVHYKKCEYSTAVQYMLIQLYNIKYMNTSGHSNICEYINAIQYTVYRLNKPEYLWTWRRINQSNPVYIYLNTPVQYIIYSDYYSSLQFRYVQLYMSTPMPYYFY
jgi:hypothetical protein